MNTIRSFKTTDDLAQGAAVAWIAAVSGRQSGTPFCVALPGGRIARAFFESTAILASDRHALFENVHFFWSDERCVPPEHPESNFGIAREALLEPMRIPQDQIHRIRGEDPPSVAAHHACSELRRISPSAPGSEPVLDLVFLGLGEDGHVASLFPGEPHSVASIPDVFRPVLNSPKPPPERVTLGYPALAAARQVWVLVSGAGKEQALRMSLAPEARTPLGRVLQSRSETLILTDLS